MKVPNDLKEEYGLVKNEIHMHVDFQGLADNYQLKDCKVKSYRNKGKAYGPEYFLDEKQKNLISLGDHEKGGVRRLINGESLAEEVNDHTFRPVLTCHYKSEPI